jgi:hypothetical protein
MDVLAHHRLCTRHAEEWIPDENDRVCIFVESLVCDGELVEYVPAEQLRGAVEETERLREISNKALRLAEALYRAVEFEAGNGQAIADEIKALYALTTSGGQ